jgi:hypothetical protein
MKLNYLLMAFVFGLAGWGGVRAEEEPNEMPYEFLYELSQLAAANTQVVLTVKSKREDLRPEDLVFTIHSASRGDLTVRVDASGQLVDFPVSEELLVENPVLTINQPPGSVTLNLMTKIPSGKMGEYPGVAKMFDFIDRGLRLEENMVSYGALALLAGKYPAGLSADGGLDLQTSEEPELELRLNGSGDDHVHLMSGDQDVRMDPVNGLITITPSSLLDWRNSWIRFCPAFLAAWDVKHEDGSWVAMNEIEEHFKSAWAREREKAQAQ